MCKSLITSPANNWSCSLSSLAGENLDKIINSCVDFTCNELKSSLNPKYSSLFP